MELAQPFEWSGGHVAVDLPGARALFTTRAGGVSAGPYDSLNLGLMTDDDPAAVAENRRRVAAAVGAPWERFQFSRQVHGTRIRHATAARPAAVTEEDGQVTALADPALVFVADCLPIALAGDGAVAALHGGWRPLAGGIVAAGVDAVRGLAGGRASEVTAALGPCARGCCYEVGEEVHAAFGGYDARRGERNLDLAAVARAQLVAAGVRTILDSGLCTICEPELFFSHRRDKGVTGRQAGIVWRA